jgi:hypothetical protein
MEVALLAILPLGSAKWQLPVICQRAWAKLGRTSIKWHGKSKFYHNMWAISGNGAIHTVLSN